MDLNEDRSKGPCKGFSKGWPLKCFKSGPRKTREPDSRKYLFFAKDCDRKAPRLGGRKFRERFFSWRMAVLSRKNFDQSSAQWHVYYHQIRDSWCSMQTTRKDTKASSHSSCSRQLVWKRVDSLSCLLRKSILPRPRRSRCRQTWHVQIFIKSNIYVLDVARKNQALQIVHAFSHFHLCFTPKKNEPPSATAAPWSRGLFIERWCDPVGCDPAIQACKAHIQKWAFVYGQKQYQHS